MPNVDLLLEALPDLEPEITDYIVSLARDKTIEPRERHDLIKDYLGSLEIPSGVNLDNLVSAFLDTFNEPLSEIRPTLDPVSICLQVIKAPVVSSPQVADQEDLELKKELLRRYDVEHNTPSVEIGEDEDDSIMGLGRNENKLRVLKDREDARLRAKLEQDEAKAQKIAQKLKSQAETIKSRTVARKK